MVAAGKEKQPITALAFDYGLRHIGVAVGNSLLANSRPVGVIRARDGAADWAAVGALLTEWQPGQIVVGLPLNMDGTPSAMSERAHRFARQLQGRYALPVTMVDERLTSFEAKQLRREQGDRRDPGRDTVDAEAACLILTDYWRQQQSLYPPPGSGEGTTC